MSSSASGKEGRLRTWKVEDPRGVGLLKNRDISFKHINPVIPGSAR